MNLFILAWLNCAYTHWRSECCRLLTAWDFFSVHGSHKPQTKSCCFPDKPTEPTEQTDGKAAAPSYRLRLQFSSCQYQVYMYAQLLERSSPEVSKFSRKPNQCGENKIIGFKFYRNAVKMDYSFPQLLFFSKLFTNKSTWTHLNIANQSKVWLCFVLLFLWKGERRSETLVWLLRFVYGFTKRAMNGLRLLRVWFRQWTSLF